LPPNQVGQHGQLQEWIQDIDAPDNNHRHMSPLWGLYPGCDITPADAKVYVRLTKDQIKDAPDYDPDRNRAGSDQDQYRNEVGTYYSPYSSQ